MRLAASLAYYTLFSLAPFMFVAISVAGLAFGHEAAAGQVYRQLEGTLGPAAASSVQDIVAAARRPGSSVLGGAIAFGLVLFGASAMLGELKESLNIIWDQKAASGGGIWRWIRGRFISIGMVMGVCFLLLVSLLVNAGLNAFSQFGINRFPGMTLLLQILSVIVSFGFISVLFAAMFKYLPIQRVAWRDVWIGGVVTAALFTLGKIGLELYIAKAAIASSYGAAGAVAVVLVWVYYSSQIFFLGAAITHAYALRHGSHRQTLGGNAGDAKASGALLSHYVVN
jgi:membrane protein